MNDCDFNQREREGFCSINVLSDSVIRQLNERYQSEFTQTTTILIKIIQKTTIDTLTAAMNVFTDGAVNNMNVNATIEWNTFSRASTATAGTGEWLWTISDRSTTYDPPGRERLSPPGDSRARDRLRGHPPPPKSAGARAAPPLPPPLVPLLPSSLAQASDAAAYLPLPPSRATFYSTPSLDDDDDDESRPAFSPFD
uniref:Uncharacterized protein n=1 Tax=Plectus sambesii TaxID=2011161 RepID=A0A914X5N4_9BILA